MTNWKEIEKEKSLYGVIARNDLNHKDRIIKRLLRIAWDQGYDLGHIELIRMELETNLKYYLDKCNTDIQIIKESLGE